MLLAVLTEVGAVGEALTKWQLNQSQTRSQTQAVTDTLSYRLQRRLEKKAGAGARARQCEGGKLAARAASAGSGRFIC